jgi:hypothetical protein
LPKTKLCGFYFWIGLLVAESDPKQKETLIRLIMHMLTIQQLESTTPNHRHRPSTIKLLAPVTVDISLGH